jgi:7-cyano-7-deazaguanine synthase
MWLDKGSTWRLAEQLGGAELIKLIREHTHTCYLGDRTRRHDWGRGCGECPACRLRAEGWERFRAGPARAAERWPRHGSTPQERNEKA